MRDYKQLIPEKPPVDLYERLREQKDSLKQAVLHYRFIGREEAEAMLECEDCGGDYRINTVDKTARLWCSECGRSSIVTYVSGNKCGAYSTENSISFYVDNEEGGYSGTCKSGGRMNCPCCGSEGRVYNAEAMRGGQEYQEFITVPTVAEGCLVLTEYIVERRIQGTRETHFADGFKAYILDGKKWVKLVRYRRFLGGGYYRLWDWEQLKRMEDDLGEPCMYPGEPDLEGTSLENGKLWEYMHQSYDSGNFLPIAYIRLYLKHKNVENLVTFGLGDMVGGLIKKSAEYVDGYYGHRRYCSPKVEEINWKKVKPHEMLELRKEQARAVRDWGWNGRRWAEYWSVRDRLGLEEFNEARKVVDDYGLKEMLNKGWTYKQIMKAVRYLKKQGRGWNTYRDYLSMATQCGMDMDSEIVRWPPNLGAAHDRAMAAVTYEKNKELNRRFLEMSERCMGLCWEKDGICIRPAQSPEELVEEGKKLHHCVGGYASRHAEGSIILFIRHKRRPERSWYTLNVDIAEKRIIQNHGYGNEWANGKKLKIRPEVQQFVTEWEREKLAQFRLPPIRKKTAI